MYCRFCGTMIPEDSSFCPKCGEKVSDENAPEVPAEENAGAKAQNAAAGDAGSAAEESSVPEKSGAECETTAEQKKKGSAAPVILMAAFCFADGCVRTLSHLNIRQIVFLTQQGIISNVFKDIALDFGTKLAVESVQQIIGIALVLLVILIRRRHLGKIKYKDLIVMGVYFVCSAVFGRLSDGISVSALNVFGDAVVMGLNNAAAIEIYIGAAILINWIVLAVFILARTDAVKFSKALWISASAAVFVFSVIYAAAAPRFARVLFMRGFPAEAVVYSVNALRMTFIFGWVKPAAELLAAFLYGRKRIGFVPALVYSPAVGIVNTACTAGAVAVMLWLHLRPGVIGLGEAAAYLLGILFMVIFSLCTGKKSNCN
ncbi:MAG: zinc ribbon domain-containing protein [Clostridiales bacterium]|nr:zinc ribbon domain-containing protein [Clostridiales bacterium]